MQLLIENDILVNRVLHHSNTLKLTSALTIFLELLQIFLDVFEEIFQHVSEQNDNLEERQFLRNR